MRARYSGIATTLTNVCKVNVKSTIVFFSTRYRIQVSGIAALKNTMFKLYNKEHHIVFLYQYQRYDTELL